MLEQLMQLMYHQIARKPNEKKQNAGFRRLAEAMFDQENAPSRPKQPEALEVDATYTASASEMLKAKDFEQMTVTEQTEAKKALARLHVNRIEVATRAVPALRTGAAGWTCARP